MQKQTMKTKLATLLLALALGAATIPTPALAANTKPYPLKVCVVSDNKLGSMGKVVTKEYQGQELKFCCKPCVKKFDANPAKYLAKLK